MISICANWRLGGLIYLRSQREQLYSRRQPAASASFLRQTHYWCIVGHPGTNPNATDSALKEQQMLLGSETSFQPCDFAFFDLITFRRSFHTLKQEEVHVILHFQPTEKEILLNF